MLRDIAAQQVTSEALKRAEQADTRASQLLRAAREANKAVALDPTNANVARRATLAREAYETRMDAAVARVRAAFSILAEQQGTKALTAQQGLQKVQNAQMREVLVTEAKGGQLRRNLMLQAAAATEKALQNVPGLPTNMGGRKVPPGAQQVTMGTQGEFRPKRYETLASDFFPEDIRAAASSLRGIDASATDFEQALTKSIETDAATVEKQALQNGAAVAQQEPGAAQLAQQAESVLSQLHQQMYRRYTLEQQSPVGVPWVHVALGVAGAFILFKVLK